MVMEEQQESLRDNEPEIMVSMFDYSIENHFKAIDTISNLCGEADTDPPEESEIQRLSSSITFLREWMHYVYQPRIVRFACEKQNPKMKNPLHGINLPQYSSATVPEEEVTCGETTSPESSRKDFVMYVGGSVWGLDWCPRVHEAPDCPVKCEYLAVAAHPPESYYHKLGEPLTGRGVVQIWSILNFSGKEEEEAPRPMKKLKLRGQHSEVMGSKSAEPKKPRGRPRKKPIEESPDESLTILKRPRGRPRKNPVNESLDSLDCNNQCIQALTVQYPESSSELLAIEGVSENNQEQPIPKKRGRKQASSTSKESVCDSVPKITVPLLCQNDGEGSVTMSHQIQENSEQNPMALDCASDNDHLDVNLASCCIPKDVTLPRIMLCLAHNGKVAWDVKWRPCNVLNSKNQHRMGYLAVLLGNGSLEVWDVPLPRAMKYIYSSGIEGSDPRFVKLEPVFRCSVLKCGGIQSIPLTVEWSISHPHDYLLAGCHDGTVALWKFCIRGTLEDTRPLLCFSADTLPIRGVAWAPVESDNERPNVILTAGHGGLKFWDIRDPFRPLWDLHPAPRFICGQDWVPDPRCIILAFDDGTMRILSLVKAANDAPVYGKSSVGPKQQGLHQISCSSYPIWSVQVSRLTGMVAYCTADGTACRFQLTSKTVEKDASRNKSPHFVCGSLSGDESVITINIPLPETPLSLSKPSSNTGDSASSLRSMLPESSQARRTNDKKIEVPTPNDQQLALYYGHDQGVESGSEETFVSKRKSKSKSSGKKNAGGDRALVCIDEEPDNLPKKESGKGGTTNQNEAIPQKIVAIHKVRWNMNKGSERWLCSGGAAGIVRCQEIIMSNLDKYLASKR